MRRSRRRISPGVLPGTREFYRRPKGVTSSHKEQRKLWGVNPVIGKI